MAYDVWLDAGKSAAHRSRTLYLFLAESIPDMLAIRSDLPGEIQASEAAVSLTDVRATINGLASARRRDRDGASHSSSRDARRVGRSAAPRRVQNWTAAVGVPRIPSPFGVLEPSWGGAVRGGSGTVSNRTNADD